MTDRNDPDGAGLRARAGFMPWTRGSDATTLCEQTAIRQRLETGFGATLAGDVFIAPDARVFTERLAMGPRSWIAAGALVRGEVTMGADCTVNPYACLSGRLVLGDGVRIASHATLVGFNHRADDPDVPIWQQGTETKGITIGDDVWIGANAVLLDGIAVGSHVVIAAGAVVSRDVTDYSVVAGVPARVVRDRRTAKRPQTTGAETAPDAARDALAALGRAATAEWRGIVDAARDAEAPGFVSVDAREQRQRTARHLCDVIEIAAGFGAEPPVADIAAAIGWLQDVQDSATGLFPDPFQPPAPTVAQHGDSLSLYNVLAVGYALECLGAAPRAPVAVFEEMSAAALCAWLEGLPWATRAWGAGAAVDALGTALYFNRRYHASGCHLETLFGWLALNVDPVSGVWGAPTAEEAMLQPVNGFYRLTRGTYAQFAVPLPAPEAAIDTVLAHRRHYRGFQGAHYTACNLLDVIHPLWLASRQTDHRHGEIVALAAAEAVRAAAAWQPGKGFAFAAGQRPGLQGTEMWLATCHLMADLLGLAADFPFQSRGVHRTRPAGRDT